MMKLNARLEKYLATALSHSMNVHTMEKFIRRVIPDYDLHQRTGFPESIPVPQQDAARRIVLDIQSEGLTNKLTELLIDVDKNGLMGRNMSIRLLPQIIRELRDMGFLYNQEYGVFIESQNVAKTKGWGILRESINYDFSFLKIDIVGNSNLVRQYSKKTIARTYNWLKSTVMKITEKREGRIWTWEGDGGLAAFYFNTKNIQSTLAGMEILHELTLYNIFERVLKKPLEIRLAVHTGPCQFHQNIKEIQSPTLRHIDLIESNYTEPNSLTISPPVYSDMGAKLEKFFEPVRVSNQQFLYRHRIDWE
jgi:hypothetical protein